MTFDEPIEILSRLQRERDAANHSAAMSEMELKVARTAVMGLESEIDRLRAAVTRLEAEVARNRLFEEMGDTVVLVGRSLRNEITSVQFMAKGDTAAKAVEALTLAGVIEGEGILADDDN